MDNIWKNLKAKGKIKTPIEIVEEIFKPLPNETDNLVGYKIQIVNFFPEEVTYSSDYFPTTTFIPFQSKKNPHPEFGYDPQSSASKEKIRFRLLLQPKKNKEISVELFKIKFPILFYPLQIFCDEHTYPEIKNFFENGKLIVRTESELIEKIRFIATSETTFNIIQRLMSF